MRHHPYLLRAALVLSALAAVLSCGRGKSVSDTPDTAFASYIKAYTGGIVSPDIALRIDLTEDVAPENQWTEGLFAFTPALEGTTRWTSPSTVTFLPADDALQPGISYQGTFFLSKVREVPKTDLRRFRFGFTVRGSGQTDQDQTETEQAEGFHVERAILFDEATPYIGIYFSAAPSNAAVKGLVELSGVERSYVEVEDQVARVYYEGRKGEMRLTVSSSVKDAEGNALGADYIQDFPVTDIPPAVEIPLSGTILPDKADLVLPFRAVNLSSVEVRIVKIYENNVLMFLQDNDLGENGSLRRAGRLVYRKDIPLDASKDLHKWNNFSLDLSGLIRKEPGAIYRIRLSFRQDQSLYGRTDAAALVSTSSGAPTAEDDAVWDKDSPWYWDNDYDWDKYDYRDINDPGKPSYYMDSDRFPAVQLFSSNLGLIAKYAGGDRIWLSASDLMTARPLPGVILEVYDYQLQKIATAQTGTDGLAQAKVSHKPFVVVGRSGSTTGYLKVNDGNEKSLSRFDVGGKVVKDGIKAFLYGERGVWRPGDTLHVTMILFDRDKAVPAAHPATLEVYTPEGQFHSSLVRTGTDGFYSFDIATSPDDPTGFWNAYAKVGGSTFHKTLHVETVKPNRLKVDADFGTPILNAGEKVSVRTAASWLTGPPAAGLKARSVLTLRSVRTSFKGFDKYTFSNPKGSFSPSETELYTAVLDGAGAAVTEVTLPAAENAPGMLNALVVTSVEESGGDESFTTLSLPFSPYRAYVGIRIPDGDCLQTDKDLPIRIAVVDAEGKRVKGHRLEYALYKTGWNWWWESAGDDLDSYVNGNSVQRILDGTLTSADKDLTVPVRIDYPDWGRFLFVVRDRDSGHVSGVPFTVDWPSYRGRADRDDPEHLTMLTLSTDKEAYKRGETATVYIPGSAGGQALVSIENASRVISRTWVKTGSGDTPFRFAVTPEMAPNFYIHVTLVQPYGHAGNDLPLRLYGVKRVNVENPDSHLVPVISMPETLHPEESFTVKVSEKGGKPMTYTLAIVDEGLLDLTAFPTPDPWSRMYETEALGVKTWDLYDQVVGTYSGRFSPVAAIGGDQDNIVAARKDNRFNPVVLVLPPRTLPKGGTAVHKLKLPMYVGSVRVMVVAGHEGAFGSADKTVAVKSPLMVVSSLPAALSPGETVSLPVNVFALEDKIREAKVDVKVEGPVKLTGSSSLTALFSKAGDQVVRFSLEATGEGTARVNVSASGGGYKASETVTLEVRNPNPAVATLSRTTLEKGKTNTLEAGENATLQLAGFPVLDAGSLYTAMRDYPYNCSEQLASRGLSMLHLLPLLAPSDAQEAKTLLPGIIRMLYARQNADGGFPYWSGGQSDTWVSSMAGQFLTEAAKAGFTVNPGVLTSWKRYQRKMTQAYRIAGGSLFSHQDEAYRLYTLAVAGDPATASMNRLRESAQTGYRASWLLASAYALCGKQQAAREIIRGIDRKFETGQPYNLTYGTALRDRMTALEALALTDDIAGALPIARDILEGAGGLSTQETAFACIALDRLHEKISTSVIKAEVAGEDVVSPKSICTMAVKGSVPVRNDSDGPLYLTLVDIRRAPAGETVAARSEGLGLSVSYVDGNGKSVNPASLPQGTAFQAKVTVKNLVRATDLRSLALREIIPSGWEIRNERLYGDDDSAGYDHLDIRDDRIVWFFDLPHGTSKTFTVSLRAAYEGSFVLPAIVCEAMYEPSVSACTASGKAAVTR